MAKYDSRIIYSFTDSLYSRADTVVRICTALSAILVGGLFALFGGVIDSYWVIWHCGKSRPLEIVALWSPRPLSV